MPRYYCDYCNIYLPHDHLSVRKQHNAGNKHKTNVRLYYQQFEEQQTQSLIDQRIKEYLGQTAAYQQVGAVFNQHLLARPRLPMMLPPGNMPMRMRPPVLPRPMMPGHGYMPPTGVPQMMAPLPGQGGGPLPNYYGLPPPPPPPYRTNPAAAPSGSFNNSNPRA